MPKNTTQCPRPGLAYSRVERTNHGVPVPPLCFVFRETYKPAYSSTTQVIEINKQNQNTEKVNEVSRTHILLKALINDSLEKSEIDRCNVSEPLNDDICKESCHDKYKIPLDCYLYPYKHQTQSPNLRLPLVVELFTTPFIGVIFL